MQWQRRAAAGTVAAGALLAVMSAPIASAASPPPVAPAPSTADLVQATLAMSDMQFQPPLLTGPTAKAIYTIGFTNPPGGQDPWPVCVYGDRNREVAVPADLAVGYNARNGSLAQTEYVYPTPAAGAAAWEALSATIAKRCSGTWTDKDGTSKVTSRRLPAQGAAGAGWSVTTVTPYNVLHVAIAPVDGGIQQVVYADQSPTLKAGVAAGVDALSYSLAGTWAKRATLPMQQGWVTVDAASSMLRPSDVPSELPVTTPQDGGWSTQYSTAPGYGPGTCGRNATAGSWSSTSSLGGWGDVTSEPGSLIQSVEAYQSDDASAYAWRQLRKAILACNDPKRPAISQTKAAVRTSSGESTFVYNGVPALWLRQFESDPQSGFSLKSYTVYVLAENNIQSLVYYETRDGMTQIPLDQLAVNVLAGTLADRVLAAQSG